MVAGAVYRPVALSVPTDGLIDHVRCPLPVPRAANCSAAPGPSAGSAGNSVGGRTNRASTLRDTCCAAGFSTDGRRAGESGTAAVL